MTKNDGGIIQVLNMEDFSPRQPTPKAPLGHVAPINYNFIIAYFSNSVNFGDMAMNAPLPGSGLALTGIRSFAIGAALGTLGGAVDAAGWGKTDPEWKAVYFTGQHTLNGENTEGNEVHSLAKNRPTEYTEDMPIYQSC